VKLNAKKARELRKQAKILSTLSEFKKFNRPQTFIGKLKFMLTGKGDKHIKGKFHWRYRTGTRAIYHQLKQNHKNGIHLG